MSGARVLDVCQACLNTSGIPDEVTAGATRLQADPTNPELLYALSDLLYQWQGWGSVRVVLEALREVSDQFELESMILDAHCAIERDEPVDVIAFHDRMQQLLEGRDVLHDPGLRYLFGRVYLRANHHFIEANHAKCIEIYNLLLFHDEALRSIVGPQISSRPSPSTTAELASDRLEARLQEANQRWDAGELEEPAVAAGINALSAEDIEGIRGKKLLIVMREYTFPSKDSRKCELPVNLVATATRAGLDVQWFPLGDPHAAPGEIEAWRPDFVVLDEVVFGALAHDSLLSLKERLGFALIVTYPDGWHPSVREQLMQVGSVADVTWEPSCPTMAEIVPPGQPGVFEALPYPFPKDLFASSEGAHEEMNAIFVGSCQNYNYLRSLWLTAMRERGIEFETVLTNPVPKPGTKTLTNEEYADLLIRSRMSIAFSSRNESVRICCGRVWESIHASALLLEEDNLQTRHYLVPYVHYVPFTGVDELGAWIAFFDEHPAWRERIIESAHQWMSTVLSNERIWARALTRARRVADGR